jgi:hypothetical protein
VIRLALALLVVAGCDDLAPDPLAPQLPEAVTLTDVSSDLDAVLEHGALADACTKYRAAASPDRRARLLCGKQMFFYESFGTVGIPAGLVEFFVKHLPEQVGAGYEKLGMVRDPSSGAGIPLGLAPSAPFGTAPALAYTCASCHFARMPDGRYAVGAPNHRFAYGTQVLGIALAPALVFGLSRPEDHAPEAVARVQPVVDAIRGSQELTNQLLGALLPLAGAGMMPTMSRENERHYALWLDGTMDFIMEPLPLDDRVHTISRIPPLWGIPNEHEAAEARMTHGMLGWAANAPSVREFLRGFVALGGGPLGDWNDERLAPLADYVHALRAPANSTPPDETLAARGRALFAEAGCRACHGGPRGGGLRPYGYDEVGTDAAMSRWLNPVADGKACCGINLPDNITLSRGIKSPRLAGLWANLRLLHNGSVATLEDLFCMNGPRGQITEPAYGDAGHTFGCDLATEDKQALIAYLRR